MIRLYPPALPNPKVSSAQKGFALVVALSLMAFLVLLILTLITILRTELPARDAELDLLRARQNALAGLDQALAILQEEMGPDQRASASGLLFKNPTNHRLPRLSPTDPRRHWTGSWDTTQTLSEIPSQLQWVRSPNNRHRQWLVSRPDFSENPDLLAGTEPSLGPNGRPLDPDRVLLVGPANSLSAEAQTTVVAPRTPLNQGTSGAFAFWIGDEGQKASIALTHSLFLPDESSPLSPGDYNRLLPTAPGTLGFAALIDFSDFTPANNPSLARDLRQTVQTAQTALTLQRLRGEATATPAQALMRERQHEITAKNYLIPVDTLRGGLKRDLSLLFSLEQAAFQATPYGGLTTPGVYPPGDGIAYNNAFTQSQVSSLFAHQAPPPHPANALVRGPTWHFLRDFHNLYRRVDSDGSFPSLAYRPNNNDFADTGRTRGFIDASMGRNDGNIVSLSSTLSTIIRPWREWRIATGATVQVPRLTTHEVAPVLLRKYMVFSFAHVDTPGGLLRIFRESDGRTRSTHTSPNFNLGSLRVSDDNQATALLMQPVVVLWNPYNIPISFQAYKLEFERPNIGLQLSWNEPDHPEVTDPDFRPRIRSSLLAFQQASTRTPGGFNNGEIGFMSLIIGSANDPRITLQPGEQRVFSATNQVLHGATVHGEDVLFLEPGIHLSTRGGLVMYRSLPISTRRSLTTAIVNQEVDNIPARPGIDINLEQVFWVQSDGRVTVAPPPSVSFANQDFLLDHLTPAQIAAGGNSVTLDHVLRHYGGQYLAPPGAPNIHAVWNPFNTYPVITYADIAAGGGVYPFLSVEFRMNPANTTEGAPLEMLSALNPFALLTDSPIFARNHAPERYQIYPEALYGVSDFNSIAPQEFFGYGYFPGSGSSRVVLQEVPTRPPWSLGSFQHANIAPNAYLPRHAIGNSQPSPFIRQDNTRMVRTDREIQGDTTFYDLSYLANEALFDRHFLSSLGGTPAEVSDNVDSLLVHGRAPNERFTLTFEGTADPTTLRNRLIGPNGYREAARHLLVQGSLNVNTLSVDAWTALLAANLNRTFATPGGPVSSSGVLISRLGLNLSAPTGGTSAEDWFAPRELSPAQIRSLASELVDEIRERGPFLSLADFVNRRPGSEFPDQQESGTIAAALARASLNDLTEGRGQEAYTRNVSGAPNFFREQTTRNTSAGIPGWITQADILTPLAPYLSARSDTFLVRTYGEAPPALGREPQRVWLEATVQRRVDYVDPAANDPLDEPADLSPLNARFGRQFQIIALRWLSEEQL